MHRAPTISGVDRYERRRKRLKALLKEAASDRLVAELAEIPPSYLSQLKTGARDIGNDVAPKLEAAMKRPEGFLDQWLPDEGGHVSASRPPDWYLLELLADLPEELRKTLRAQIVSSVRAFRKASSPAKKVTK